MPKFKSYEPEVFQRFLHNIPRLVCNNMREWKDRNPFHKVLISKLNDYTRLIGARTIFCTYKNQDITQSIMDHLVDEQGTPIQQIELKTETEEESNNMAEELQDGFDDDEVD